MDTVKHLYIVSFGNSDKYRLETEEPLSSPLHTRHEPIDEIESKVRSALEKKFPGEPLAYFFTPKVEEVFWGDRDKYLGYPEFNDSRLPGIVKVLSDEIKDMESVKVLNLNRDSIQGPNPDTKA